MALLLAVPAFARRSDLSLVRRGLITSEALCVIGLIDPFAIALGWCTPSAKRSSSASPAYRIGTRVGAHNRASVARAASQGTTRNRRYAVGVPIIRSRAGPRVARCASACRVCNAGAEVVEFVKDQRRAPDLIAFADVERTEDAGLVEPLDRRVDAANGTASCSGGDVLGGQYGAGREQREQLGGGAASNGRGPPSPSARPGSQRDAVLSCGTRSLRYARQPRRS